MSIRLHNYDEVRAYPEKEHVDWLRTLTPRHITRWADYWPQKVLTVSSVNAAMQNYVSMYEHQTRPNPALEVVHGHAAMLCATEAPTVCPWSVRSVWPPLGLTPITGLGP